MQMGMFWYATDLEAQGWLTALYFFQKLTQPGCLSGPMREQLPRQVIFESSLPSLELSDPEAYAH